MTTAVVVILKGQALVQAGQQAKAHIDAAGRHEGKAGEQYKSAGAYLADAKRSVKHGQWLSWLEKYGIAERTAQLCLQVYENPEKLTEVRESKAAQMRTARAVKSAPRGADLAPAKSKKSVVHASDPIQEDCEDCTTEQQRWERSAGNFLGDMVAMRAYWKREFGKWESFERPSALVSLAKQASSEWIELANILINK